MNKAVIYSKIENENIVLYSDLFSDANKIVHKVKLSNNTDFYSIKNWKNFSLEIDYQSDFANEIFHYYMMPHLYLLIQYQEKNAISHIIFKGKHPSFHLIGSYFKDKNVKISGLNSIKLSKTFFNYIKSYITVKTHIISLLTITYYLFRKIKNYSKNSISSSDFALIHSKAALKNISKLKLKLNYFYEDKNIGSLKSKNTFPLYSTISIQQYIYLLKNSFYNTQKLINSILNDSIQMIGNYGAIKSLNFFSKRIAHFIVVKKAYNNIFLKNPECKFYSGERESRFGVLSMKMANFYKNSSVCIPHGMAYSYNYPLGIFGHEYYCTSIYEKDFLTEMYPLNKYYFDINICKKIFQVKKLEKKPKRLVFFTEPRRQQVNFYIIKNLIKISGLDLFIKIHPLEKKQNYRYFKTIKFIDDFDDAISDNICLSRKSTILIEAVYNNSNALAVLVDDQDKYDFENTFVSLMDPNISKFYSFTDLVVKIKKLKNEI